jgi:hypothetical protein
MTYTEADATVELDARGEIDHVSFRGLVGKLLEHFSKGNRIIDIIPPSDQELNEYWRQHVAGWMVPTEFNFDDGHSFKARPIDVVSQVIEREGYRLDKIQYGSNVPNGCIRLIAA